MEKNKIYLELPEEYLRKVLNYEGGYVNDPLDLGGETNRGITIGALNKAKKQGLVDNNVTIKSLTNDLETVRKIYDINYYKRSKANLMPHPLAFAHFDASVNHGSGNSGKFLQRALNKLNYKVDIDGGIGPKTLAALNKCLNEKDILELVAAYNYIRLTFYNSIVNKRPSNKRFYNGWINRLNSVKQYCEE